LQPSKKIVAMPQLILVFVALALFPILVAAADLEREKRIAGQIREAVVDGQPVFLQDGSHEFLSLYQRTEKTPASGGVIVIHGLDANPDWVDVVRPLRVGLAEHGWDTLSIQAPLAREAATDREWDETVPEAIPRIEAALAFLKQQNVLNIAIVGYSHGARMAAHYLAQRQPPEVRALVVISMSADPSEPQQGNLGALREIKLPILDVFGENDLPSVLDTRKQRRLAARDAENNRYRQTAIPGADHFFVNQEELLLSTIRAWLAREASGSEVQLN